MFDKAGEMNKPVNASRMKIRGAFTGTRLKYEDREVTFANGDVCTLRIMEPGPADFNWWQSRVVADSDEEGKVVFPSDCYPDILIRAVYDPETDEPVFDATFRSYLRKSGEPQIIAIAVEWLKKINKIRPTQALKNLENLEEENSTSSGSVQSGESDPV